MTADLIPLLQVWWKSTFPAQQIDSDYHSRQTNLRQTAAQHCILGSLVVLMSEQRSMVAAGQIQVLRSTLHIHLQLCQVLQNLRTQGLPIPQDWLQPAIVLEDAVLSSLLTCLDALPDHPLTPTSRLGQVYESFLKYSPTATQARKSGGVYYTPQAIADYIVEETVGTIVKYQLPRVLDPACGSGVFLQTAYQYLLDWHLQNSLANAQEILVEVGGQLYLPIAERRRLLTAIYGVDIDPQAVAVTQISLLLKLMESPEAIQAIDRNHPISGEQTLLPDLSHNIRSGNALIGSDFYTQPSSADRISDDLDDITAGFDWDQSFPAALQAGGFDVVIGNPPYIDAETMTRCCPGWRSYCTRHYRTASGNWDIFCLFIEKALERCKDGGLTSMIVPHQLASANYAAVARSLLSRENQLLSIRDYAQVTVFPVAVYPIVYVAQKRLPNPDQPVRYEVMTAINRNGSIASHYLNYAHFWSNQHPWSLSINAQQLNVTARLRHDFPTLTDMAQVKGAATVAEAYALQPLIQEKQEIETGDLRLVNSGTIDRYQVCWGEKRLRYLGATFLHPVIPHWLTAQLSPRRLHQAHQPKLLVAGMTKRLECAVDLTGTILAGKSTCIILTSMDLRYLLGLLNSSLVNLYFTHSFSGNRLQGGYLRVGPPQLRQMPMPRLDWGSIGDRHRHDRLIDLVDQLLVYQQIASPSCDQPQAIDRQMLKLEQQIDQLVYELYRLTDAEIEAVGELNAVRN